MTESDQGQLTMKGVKKVKIAARGAAEFTEGFI